MNAWKQYGAHALVYLIGALTLVHAYAPLVVPGKGVAIAAAAAVILAAIHQIQALSQSPVLPAPVPGTTDKQSGRATVALLGVLFAIVLAGIPACGTLTKIMSNPTSATAVQAAVDLSVGTLIQETAKTPAAQAAEAAQIQAVATALEGVLTGQQVTLAALDAALQAKIDAANLPPADKAAAMLLASTVQSIILQQIRAPATGMPPLSADQTVAVKAVLDDVIQAAGFYGVHARAVLRADLAR